MPAPRPSQSAEAARAAALQAEFNEKKWVWVPDEKEGYLAGWVHKEDGEFGDIIMASGGEIRTVPLYALSKMNPPKFDRVEDIADLTFLNEASVVHNLRLRYGSGAIYTYSGLFLVAVNPYQNLPLYSDSIIHQYRNKRRDENPPHIFAIAEKAWVNMGEERENQSILITGESGAGKTESTKKVIQYLAAIASDAHMPADNTHSRTQSLVPSGSFSSSTMPATGLPRTGSFTRGHAGSLSTSSSGTQLNSKGRLGLLERQILQANPILEAFGNAQTQRNNNSSRFGKFVRIMFAPDGSIAGANIDWYLLEKSRVVVRSEAERSFHVFYQLLAGGGSIKDKLLLGGGVEDYEYLNKSRREVDGVNDLSEWNALIGALNTVGFTAAEQFDLFRVVAAILHLGNIVITSTRAGDAVLPDPSQAERVCHLLGIPVTEFTRAVLQPRVLAGREWVSQARTQQQALDELAALCKTLYERSFGNLVDRINKALDRPSSKSSFIGVLDIAGFEIFEVNAYEQLLINYTNERLQQFFNHHMFVLEQEEYNREGIEWDYVNFGLDLQPTIDLIEASGPHIGILSCLDEECIMPKATDLTFTNKLHQMWGGEYEDPQDHPGKDKYEPTRFTQGFIIQHYAGKVEYRTDGWLEKNKDPLNDNLTRVLASSTESYISGLFADYVDTLPLSNIANQGNLFSLGKKRALKKGAFRTVGQRHKEQLASLMAQLQATQPHFVRCIVPNANKKPLRVDVPLVLDQLRCNGVLEGIRIARLGYPNRLPFVEFRQRYELLTPGIIPRGYMDGRKACLRMVDALELDKTMYKVGTSKIFFKAGVLAELEERRDALLYDIFSRLQAVARMYSGRRQMKKILNRAVAIRTIQRNARVYGDLRDWPWWQLYTKVRPLLAATRNDEELRRKEAELARLKEQAEREKQEREAFEKVKASLAAEKHKAEEALKAERALTLDKDALLARSKKREAELEEEVAVLQNDLEVLDSQLDRVMKFQKEGEENNKSLREAFDQAAEHLVRMENEQKEWQAREAELAEQLEHAQAECEALQNDLDELQRLSEELRNLAAQREEDLSRLKERTEQSTSELEGKFKGEQRQRELLKEKLDSTEEDMRHAKEQLAELGRAATEYTTIIQRKEEAIADITSQLQISSASNEELKKQILDLQSDIDLLASQLQDATTEKERDVAAKTKLQEELDELRSVLEAKTTEETRRREVDKSREEEVAELRSQVATLQQEFTTSRKQATEAQSKLSLELENAKREHASIQRTYDSLLERERAAQAELEKSRTSLSDLERGKRSLESELQSLRGRQIEAEEQLSQATKAKESLERQLSSAQSKFQDVEDVVLQLEREKASNTRQLETLKSQLEAETTKRTQLERAAASQKTELIQLKDRNIKADRELNRALKDLKDKEWEVKQLESKQNKTIVEHVHVLQEAKRVTDEQLRDARAELARNATYIRSLEKAKSIEQEDMQHLAEQQRIEMRNRDKLAKTQEEKLKKATADQEKERRNREEAELQVRRLQLSLDSSKTQVEELEQQLGLVQRSKDNLEQELEKLADQTTAPSVPPKSQREYEQRISELESQLEQKDRSRSIAAKIKQRMDQHHAEIRQLVLNGGPKDSAFRSKLLHELQLAEEELEKAISARSRRSSATTNKTDPSTTSSSSKHTPSNHRKSLPDSIQDLDSERHVSALKQHVQVLEIQMAASERIRVHLEASLREVTAELESSDDSKQVFQQQRTRLAEENARLKELLAEEAEARRAAEASEIDGVQSMWNKFQSSIAEERANYARLEDSRKALVVKQRNAQAELDAQKSQTRELSQAKKQLQTQLSDIQEQLAVAKVEVSDLKRQLQKRSQEDEISSSTSSAANAELRAVIGTYKSNEEGYKKQIQAAEMALAKAARAESTASRTITDLENARAEIEKAKQSAEERLRGAEQTIEELQKKLEEEASLDSLRQRLAESLEHERAQHKKDLADRDFAGDQTRKKYQAELAQLSEELQSQRDSLSRLREENRKIRSDYDELQLRFDDEVYNSGGWKKEKERMDTKIADLTKAYETSVAANTEQQSQIVSLHSQVRELRSVLNDAEADRALLQKARRALQAELETIKLDHVDTNKMSSDRELQRLQLKKQDLERLLEEQADRVANATERMKKAEAYANESQVELGKVRVENSELDRLNAHLEKQIKELNVRIVDLETKSWTSSPRPTSGTMRRMEARVEELTTQLQQAGRQRVDSTTSNRLARLEEERKQYEQQVDDLRKQVDMLQNSEQDLNSSKRKAERQAMEYKQKAASLEREVERLRNRLDRPASSVGSPHSSPRK